MTCLCVPPLAIIRLYVPRLSFTVFTAVDFTMYIVSNKIFANRHYFPHLSVASLRGQLEIFHSSYFGSISFLSSLVRNLYPSPAGTWRRNDFLHRIDVSSMSLRRHVPAGRSPYAKSARSGCSLRPSYTAVACAQRRNDVSTCRDVIKLPRRYDAYSTGWCLVCRSSLLLRPSAGFYTCRKDSTRFRFSAFVDLPVDSQHEYLLFIFLSCISSLTEWARIFVYILIRNNFIGIIDNPIEIRRISRIKS